MTAPVPFDRDAAFKAMAKWVAQGSGLPNAAIVWAGQGGGVPLDDSKNPLPTWISLSISGDEGFGDEWRKVEDNPLEIADQTVSTVDATANTLRIVGHPYASGDGAGRLTTTGVAPGGTSISVDYWLVVVDADHLKLTTSRAAAVAVIPGPFVDITDVGSGTLKIKLNPDATRPLTEVRHIAEGHRVMTLSMQCFGGGGAIGNASALAALSRIRSARRLPGQLETLRAAGMAVANVARATLIGGSLSGASSFEPRGQADVRINYLDRAIENTAMISDVDAEGDVTF